MAIHFQQFVKCKKESKGQLQSIWRLHQIDKKIKKMLKYSGIGTLKTFIFCEYKSDQRSPLSEFRQQKRSIRSRPVRGRFFSVDSKLVNGLGHTRRLNFLITQAL